MKFPQIPLKTQFVPCAGGLDTETPMFSVKPGHVMSAQNVFQGSNGGYYTTKGYERFSGQEKPSSAQYATLPVAITGSVSVGDIVTDATAAAYGTVIAIESTRLVLTKITGIFAVGNIKVGAVVVGTCSAAQTTGNASTKRLDAQYKNLAADLYRADISAVPGSGDLRGIDFYDGKAYAFRNNAGGTAVDAYVSSSSGWTLVSLGRELSFTSGGAYQVQEGNTITGEISGATAVITRVVLESGTWAGGTAAGRFIFASQTGTFQAETVRVGATLNVATIAGNSSAITFANPNGRFEFVHENFTGSQDTIRIYGCDGKNRGFEFDGTVFVPIDSEMSTYPTHVIGHKYQLFFSFLGSAQHSAPGFPYQWSPIVGADELGMSDHITGFVSQPGSDTAATLSIMTRNSIGMLYGSSVADWNLLLYKRGAGAIEWTPQFIGNTFMLDDRGITKLATSQSYGNFEDATVSGKFKEWLETKKNQVTASCVCIGMNLYCIFFADRTALFCTVKGGEIIAAMPMVFPHKITCAYSGEDASGDEIILLGAEGGYVYEYNRGTSFDGEEIEWFFEESYNHFNSPNTIKRFRKCTNEISGEGYAEFNFSYKLEYGSGLVVQPTRSSVEMILASESWDAGVTWDSGAVWDGVNLSPISFKMCGSGTNVSLKFQGRSDFNTQLIFSGSLVQYSMSREKR